MAVSSKALARWYRELAQNLQAGIPLPRALVAAGGAPLKDRKRFAERLAAGDPLPVVLENAGRWLPGTDRQIITTAAESGRLVEGLRVLAEKHQVAAQQGKQAFVAVLYPLFIINFGTVAVPLYLLFTRDLATYLQVVALILVPLWCVILMFTWGVRRRHRWLQRLLRLVPLLRGYSKNRSLADLCFTLEAYLASGQRIDLAWVGAGRASGDARLARVGEKVAEEVRHGVQPSAVLEKARGIPEDFTSLYRNGEETGQLPENVLHLRVLYSEKATAKLQQATFWYPALLVILVAAGVGFVVISTYARYLQEVLRMLDA